MSFLKSLEVYLLDRGRAKLVEFNIIESYENGKLLFQ